MTPDRPTSRRTAHPDPYATPHPSDPLPSVETAVVLAALPIATIAVLSFPVAAAVALAAVCGAVAGAALHRRHPSTVDRTFRLLGDDAIAADG